MLRILANNYDLIVIFSFTFFVAHQLHFISVNGNLNESMVFISVVLCWLHNFLMGLYFSFVILW